MRYCEYELFGTESVSSAISVLFKYTSGVEFYWPGSIGSIAKLSKTIFIPRRSKPVQRSKKIQRFYENFCALNAVLVCEDLKDTYETWSEHFPGSSIAILS